MSLIVSLIVLSDVFLIFGGLVIFPLRFLEFRRLTVFLYVFPHVFSMIFFVFGGLLIFPQIFLHILFSVGYHINFYVLVPLTPL